MAKRLVFDNNTNKHLQVCIEPILEWQIGKQLYIEFKVITTQYDDDLYFVLQEIL